MAFSTFVFDTLDVSTRLGRYLLQELFGLKTKTFSLIATLITIGGPMFLIIMATPGSYIQFWTLFGASNQLLAGLTLLFITMWLYRARKRLTYTLLPMLFVLTISLWALGDLVWENFSSGKSTMDFVNGVIALGLICLGVFLLLSALNGLRLGRVKSIKDA